MLYRMGIAKTKTPKERQRVLCENRDTGSRMKGGTHNEVERRFRGMAFNRSFQFVMYKGGRRRLMLLRVKTGTKAAGKGLS